MKKMLLILAFGINAVFAQTSPYLLNPEKAVGYVDSCANFWLSAYDQNNGGFYTNIDRQGNLISAWGTNKNMLTQTRDAYGFVRAYMLTGNDVYLQMAKAALDFLYAHAWDVNNGGWFSELSATGNPTNPGANKTAFDQHYALLGIGAYFEATGDTTSWDWIKKGYNHLENVFWDDRADYFGYYDVSNSQGTSVTNKSFNATVDAVTTHLLQLYLLTENPVYRERLIQMADNMLNRLVAGMDAQAIGFVEKYNSDWDWNNGETMTIMGHVLKTAWCLGRIYQFEPDPNYLWGAEKLITDVLDKGYDHELGGPYKDYNRVTGQMIMWGNPDTAKAWWQMEQAVTAGLEWHYLTNDQKYLDMADETLDFFMKFFVDHDFGEVYENRTRHGAQTWGDHKGNGFKAGYHSIELGYYTYLYGKLFTKNETALLHYKFAPIDSVRDILLSPLSSAAGELRIQSVLLDGGNYSDYNPETRVLHLPANIGGHFEVTFQLSPATGIADADNQPRAFELFQNYPNPFNPSTTIRYRLDNAGTVNLTVFNIRGQVIKTLVSRSQPIGNYEVEWDGLAQSGQPAASGLYFYELKTGDFRETKRMILLR